MSSLFLLFFDSHVLSRFKYEAENSESLAWGFYPAEDDQSPWSHEACMSNRGYKKRKINRVAGGLWQLGSGLPLGWVLDLWQPSRLGDAWCSHKCP
jgi:hypothetical protein